MAGAVPATLHGATVLPTAAAAKAWIDARHPVLIDVAPAPKKPPSMAPGMPWLPAAHKDLPGSIWLPGAGRAVLAPDGRVAYLRAVGAHATPETPVVVYCHPNCWASWNAAKALVQAGYQHVAWYEAGIEGWVASGYALQTTPAIRYE